MAASESIPQMAQVRVISDTRDRVGESPVWSVTEQALYWVDIEGRRIHRWDSAAGTVQSWHTPERVGCIAVSARGGLVAAMETGIFEIELQAPPLLLQFFKPQSSNLIRKETKTKLDYPEQPTFVFSQ